jgi:hypothetical protein
MQARHTTNHRPRTDRGIAWPSQRKLGRRHVLRHHSARRHPLPSHTACASAFGGIAICSIGRSGSSATSDEPDSDGRAVVGISFSFGCVAGAAADRFAEYVIHTAERGTTSGADAVALHAQT